MSNLSPRALALYQAHGPGPVDWERMVKVVDAASGWVTTSDAPEKPGTYINVRSVTSYRWLAYKPDGARQMKRAGRWQRATEHGWENAPLPDGEFQFLAPLADAKKSEEAGV